MECGVIDTVMFGLCECALYTGLLLRISQPNLRVYLQSRYAQWRGQLLNNRSAHTSEEARTLSRQPSIKELAESGLQKALYGALINMRSDCHAPLTLNLQIRMCGLKRHLHECHM
jgi:hypothetical protein